MIVQRSRAPAWRMFALAVAAVLTMLAGQQAADAGSIIKYRVNDGTWETLVSSATGSFATYVFPNAPESGSLSPFKITVASVEGHVPAKTADVSFGVANLNTSGNDKLEILFISGGAGTAGYDNPVAPPTLVWESEMNGVGAVGITGMSFRNIIAVADASSLTETILTTNLYDTGNINATALTATTWKAEDARHVEVLSSGYVLAQMVTIEMNFGGSIQFDGETRLVPEPTSMALLGIGVVGMAGYGCRRWRQRGQTQDQPATPAV